MLCICEVYIMKPLSTRRNQFHGINPHLHSVLQAEGDWVQFHLTHICDLIVQLKPLLMAMGYTAQLEPSIQVRRLDDRWDNFDPDFGAISQKPYRALAIYDLRLKPGAKGDPVAWIELLSPSNKPGGRDAGPYQGKRAMLLQSGIVFVEIDYLHESPATFPNLLIKAKVEDTYPYHLLIIDPRPDLRDGQAMVKGLHVDDPLPTLPIPLSGQDMFTFDFGPAYRKTFEEMLFGLESVDYRELPLRLERYHPFDQTRIYNRLIAVLTAAREGRSLEGDPLPVEALPLDEARARFDELRQVAG
jgi:hypothetical protein